MEASSSASGARPGHAPRRGWGRPAGPRPQPGLRSPHRAGHSEPTRDTAQWLVCRSPEQADRPPAGALAAGQAGGSQLVHPELLGACGGRGRGLVGHRPLGWRMAGEQDTARRERPRALRPLRLLFHAAPGMRPRFSEHLVPSRAGLTSAGCQPSPDRRRAHRPTPLSVRRSREPSEASARPWGICQHLRYGEGHRVCSTCTRHQAPGKGSSPRCSRAGAERSGSDGRVGPGNSARRADRRPAVRATGASREGSACHPPTTALAGSCSGPLGVPEAKSTKTAN